MADFNKTLLFNNISYLLEEQNKKIGELEKEANVSTGYISRTKEGNSKPGIDFIMNVSEILKVSMDVLLKVDLSQLTATERYLLNFLQKLIKDTVDDKLNWQIETADELNRLETDQYHNTHHPLFSEETYVEEGDTEYPEEVTSVVFPSHSFGAPTYITGDCYHLVMKNETVLYLMDISKSVYRNGDTPAFAKELWITNPLENQYLCANNDGSSLAPFVDELYTAVAENSKHPKIDRNFKHAIDGFMQDDLGNDPDYKTSDEELPFS